MKIYQCVPDSGGWDKENQYFFCVEYNNEYIQRVPTPSYTFIRDGETFNRWFNQGHLSRTVIK